MRKKRASREKKEGELRGGEGGGRLPHPREKKKEKTG